MKNIKLILSITLCTSLSTFAMEKEKSRASHSWSEEGPIGDISGESKEGAKIQHLLKISIDDLNVLLTNIKREQASNDTSLKIGKELKRVKQLTLDALKEANDMLLGRKQADIEFIKTRARELNNEWLHINRDTESGLY